MRPPCRPRAGEPGDGVAACPQPATAIRRPWLIAATRGGHYGDMAEQTHDQQQTLERIRQVRAEALEYTRKARQLAAERRALIKQLIAGGLSKTDIARELGVTRQAIQKMLAC